MCDSSPAVHAHQRVDIARIRAFFVSLQNHDLHCFDLTEARRVGPMIIEMCDLVEESDLLQNAAKARQEAEWLDEPLRITTTHEDSIMDLDFDPATRTLTPEFAEQLLPSIP